MITTKREIKEVYDTNDINNNGKYFNQFNWNGIIEGKNIYDLNQESFANAQNVWVDDDSLISRPPLIVDKSLPDFAVPNGYKLIEELELEDFTVYVSSRIYTDLLTNEEVTEYYITIDGTEETTFTLTNSKYKLATISHYIIVFNENPGARVFDINRPDEGWRRLTDLAEVSAVKSIIGSTLTKYPQNNFTNAYKVIYFWSLDNLPVLPETKTAEVEVILSYIDEVKYKLSNADKWTEYRVVRPINHIASEKGIFSVAYNRLTNKNMVAVAYDDYFLISFDGGETFTKEPYPEHKKFLSIASLFENGNAFGFVALDGVHVCYWGDTFNDKQWTIIKALHYKIGEGWVEDDLVIDGAAFDNGPAVGDNVDDAEIYGGIAKFIDYENAFAFTLYTTYPHDTNRYCHFFYLGKGLGADNKKVSNTESTADKLNFVTFSRLNTDDSAKEFQDFLYGDNYKFARDGYKDSIRFSTDLDGNKSIYFVEPAIFFDDAIMYELHYVYSDFSISGTFKETSCKNYVIDTITPMSLRIYDVESKDNNITLILDYFTEDRYSGTGWKQKEVNIEIDPAIIDSVTVNITEGDIKDIEFPSNIPKTLPYFRYRIYENGRATSYYLYGDWIIKDDEAYPLSKDVVSITQRECRFKLSNIRLVNWDNEYCYYNLLDMYGRLQNSTIYKMPRKFLKNRSRQSSEVIIPSIYDITIGRGGTTSQSYKTYSFDGITWPATNLIIQSDYNTDIGSKNSENLGVLNTVNIEVWMTNSGYYIQLEDNNIWTNNIGENQVWLTYTYRPENDEYIEVPDLTYSDTELYMTFGNQLRITNNISDGLDIKFNLPDTNDQSFISNIGAMVNISTTELALFLKDKIVICARVEDEVYGYRYDYYNSRLSIGVRPGDSVINTLEGQYTIIPTRRGLAFMGYQQFMATTDQTLAYISENISERWTKFYDDGNRIEIIQWRDYLIISNGTKDLLLLYLTGETMSWWHWQIPVKPTKLLTNQVDLKLLSDTRYIFKESERYFDFSGSLREKRIKWLIQSQPLHMKAPMYYKSIRQLIFQLVETTKEKTSLLAQIKLYRKHVTVKEPEVIKFKVEEFKTFVKRFNYWKINELQWALSDDEESVNPAQLKLNGMSVKYEIGSEVK